MLAAGVYRSIIAPFASRAAFLQLPLELSSCASRAADTSTTGSQTAFQRFKHDSSTRYGTTVLCVRKGDQVVMIADGQVTQGYRVMKPNAKKIRRLSETVVGGFAGATADALTLFERLENKLEEHSGQLKRAAVELAKAWRQDRVLRRLEASMLVADAEVTLEITGDGDVLEPHDGVLAIGSGGGFALAAARALMDMPDMDAKAIALKSMNIAADICVMTNHNFTIEVLEGGKLLDNNSDGSDKPSDPSTS